MMKESNKSLKYFTIIIFLLIPFTNITKPFTGVMLDTAMGKEDLRQIQDLSNTDILHQLIIIPEHVKNTDSLVNMVRRINQIDRPILQLLVDQGVKVRLFEGKLTDEPLLYYLNWDKPRGWKSDVTWEDVPGSGGNWLVSAKIGSSFPGSGHGSINLELHEIGHTVYNLLMTSPAYAQAISTAWQKEAVKFFPKNKYYMDYSSEYFAEMFAYYYYNEEKLETMKEKVPQTYRLFKTLRTLNNHSVKRNYYSF